MRSKIHGHIVFQSGLEIIESKIDNQDFKFEWNHRDRIGGVMVMGVKPLESNDDFNEIN